jgi:hypothetical protein
VNARVSWDARVRVINRRGAKDAERRILPQENAKNAKKGEDGRGRSHM